VLTGLLLYAVSCAGLEWGDCIPDWPGSSWSLVQVVRGVWCSAVSRSKFWLLQMGPSSCLGLDWGAERMKISRPESQKSFYNSGCSIAYSKLKWHWTGTFACRYCWFFILSWD